jgi:hypothetical protein
MIDKKLYKPEAITRWGWIIYERQQRFDRNTANTAIAGMIKACRSVGKLIRRCSTHLVMSHTATSGMAIHDDQPPVRWENPQGRVFDVSTLRYL